MEGEKIIILQTNDGSKFEIDHKSAEKSLLLKRLIAEFSDESVISLNNEEIDADTCKHIMEYLNHYREISSESIKEIWKPLKTINMKDVTHGDTWAAEFIDRFQALKIVSLANASSFFEINSLSNLCCAKIASIMIKYQEDGNKLREIFNLADDMTDDDLKKIEDEEAKMNPYELLIRNSITIAHPYDEEHNREENDF